MRGCQAVVLAVLAGALAGCFPQPRQATDLLSQSPFAGPIGDDVVFLDVAVIERPYGDRFLNRELWADANEQVVPFEQKVALEANGFRVGQVGGLLPPTKLQDMLLSKRSCQANRIHLHAGHEKDLPLGSVLPRCRCQLRLDGQKVDVDLKNAQCLLEVAPSLAEDGQVRLRFTPHIKHGESKSAFTSLRDAAGTIRWERREQQPEEKFPWLSWSLTVAPNEYVVIGTDLEGDDTLGQQFFLSDEGPIPIRRLLVIRTAHAPSPAGPVDEKSSRSPPLALRAGGWTARGSGD